jgi:hypothetical protein
MVLRFELHYLGEHGGHLHVQIGGDGDTPAH